MVDDAERPERTAILATAIGVIEDFGVENEPAGRLAQAVDDPSHDDWVDHRGSAGASDRSL
jgi:hypothetical protein